MMLSGRNRRVWSSFVGISLVITLSVAAYRFRSAEAESFNPRVVMYRPLPSIENAPFFNADEVT